MKSKEGTGLHLLILIKEKNSPEDKEELAGQFIIGDATNINVGIQGGFGRNTVANDGLLLFRYQLSKAIVQLSRHNPRDSFQ